MTAMDYGLRGKTAIVTGASQGIGREIARALHEEGVSVLLVGQTRARLDQTVRDLRGASGADGAGDAAVHAVVADLSLLGEVERVTAEAMQRLGRIDILINNAARTRTGAFFGMSDDDLQDAWQVKGLGYVRLVRAVAPHMMRQRDGRIVNVLGATARTPTADFIVGSMVNAALVNFTRGVSRELARSNIRINSISPGWTLTERISRSIEMQAHAQNIAVEEVIQREARSIPTGRPVTMREVATLTLLAVSDLCPSLTGEDIIVDGGATPSI